MKFEKAVRILIFSIVLVSVTRVSGQIPTDILPMKSSCSDVAKILGVKTCEKAEETYDLRDEKVFISYTLQPSPLAFKKRWRVPAFTVLSVIRIPKKRMLLTGLDLGACLVSDEPRDVPNSRRYECEKLGITIDVYEGYVSSITFWPTPDDERLLVIDSCDSAMILPESMNPSSIQFPIGSL